MNSSLQNVWAEAADPVEFRTLGEIVVIRDSERVPIARDLRTEGAIPYYGANGIQGYVSEHIFEGTFLLVGEDGSVINQDGSPVLNWATGKIWVNNHAHVLAEKPEVAVLRYVYHALAASNVKRLVRGAPPKINQASLREIRIPVPSIDSQIEIVDFLDTITSLETELESELQAREKQLEHYRNELLTFDTKSSGVWASFGEVCKVATGTNIGKGDIRNKPGIYPVINSGIEPLGYFAEFNSQDDPIGITSRGAGVGSITWCEGKYFRGGLNYSATIRDEKRLSVRFLYHWLLHSKGSLAALSTFSGIPALNKGSLERLLVPLIPLEEQNEITSILDKLEALMSDPSSGLAAELRSRRYQYEYYRDKLLNFKEA